ncbi:MAG: hypothetical protein ACYDHX_11000 [Methanothrix sp.]
MGIGGESDRRCQGKGIDGRKRPSPLYPCLIHTGGLQSSPRNVSLFSDSVRENIHLGGGQGERCW